FRELGERVGGTLPSGLLRHLAGERDRLVEGLRRVGDRGVEGCDGVFGHEREKLSLRRRVRGDGGEHALAPRRRDEEALGHATVLEGAREGDRLDARSARAVEELPEGREALVVRARGRVVYQGGEPRAVEEAEHAVNRLRARAGLRE